MRTLSRLDTVDCAVYLDDKWLWKEYLLQHVTVSDATNTVWAYRVSSVISTRISKALFHIIDLLVGFEKSIGCRAIPVLSCACYDVQEKKQPFGYEGSIFHRAIPGFMVQVRLPSHKSWFESMPLDGSCIILSHPLEFTPLCVGYCVFS